MTRASTVGSTVPVDERDLIYPTALWHCSGSIRWNVVSLARAENPPLAVKDPPERAAPTALNDRQCERYRGIT